MSGSLEFKLLSRIDKNGNEYLIGSPNFPANVNLNDFTIIVFYPEEEGGKATIILRPKEDKK
jgi:hypothetical protein